MDDLRDILDLNARAVFFPVRHHSPTCARLVHALTLRLRPAAVLIEGPFDFNDRLGELALPHRLPIAVYSYVRLPNGHRRAAYYPFCIYSPEWQALEAAREVGAAARFIDLPWADVATDREPSNRYADADLRRGAYVRSLCRQLGVDNFDGLWDTLVELDAGLTVETYLERFHHFCYHVRLLEDEAGANDRRREAFMAAEVRRALGEVAGRVLVVTGGYHSFALFARLAGRPFVGADEPAECRPSPPQADEERGIALTPYSYEQLDSLTGYEAGMPNPGFYHQVWHDRHDGRRFSHRSLLARVVGVLRQRGQMVSAADLIAAETTAQGLAAVRGHDEVWRSDLVDGITGALVKEELAYGVGHPLLDAVHEVLRGGERGRLAEGTPAPPLVQDLKKLLHEHDLEPGPKLRDVELDLHEPADRGRSRLLHRVRLLGIAGYERTGGTDLAARDDLSRVWETWRVRWLPDFDATAVEASRYGPTLAEAVGARLTERAEEAERDAGQAALLLLDAALAGLDALAGGLRQRLSELLRTDGDFVNVTAALGHLLYLYRYDAVLDTAGRGDVGGLLREAFGRGLWLLESLGQVSGRDAELLDGVRALLEAFEHGDEALALDRDEFVSVLRRVEQDLTQLPGVRGAAVGALWTLGAADADQVRADLRYFADPDRMGDFLAGLFCLAREAVQRQPELVRSIDDVLMGYGDDDFLRAVPSLRLAFTYFSPREKHHLALTLLQVVGMAGAKPLAALEVSAEDAARALALEARLFAAAAHYGLRGGKS